MNISSIGSGVKPCAPQTNPNNNTLSELQRQRDTLTRQLEAVKAKPKNSQAEQNAAEKQIKALEKQIAGIDQKIQKASQNKSGEASAESKNTENIKAIESSAFRKNSTLQTDDLTENSVQELRKKNKSPFENENIIDIYV